MSQINLIHRKIERKYLEISHMCHRHDTVLLSTAGSSETSVFV